MLTCNTAVFLCAKAQAGSTGITTQIMLAGIYLSPAVILYFAINWLWGEETKGTGNDDAGETGSPSPEAATAAPNSISFQKMFQGMLVGEGFETPTNLV